MNKPKKSVTNNKSRKRRNRDQLKADIVAAGTELFAEQGYTGPSIRDIAKKAEVALPALYRFFVNKHDLYVQCCKEGVQKDLDFLNLEPTLKNLKNTSPETILYFTTIRLLHRQYSPEIPHIVSRALFDGHADLIRDETESVFKSDFFQITADASAILSSAEEAIMRLVFVHTMVFSFQSVFSFWQPFYQIAPISDNSETMAIQILSTVYPKVDWQHVAKSNDTPTISPIAGAKT